MSKIKLTGDSSGYVEISAGDNAGNNTLELPTSGTKVVASDSSNNVNGLGIVTATTFSGGLTGDVTGNLTGNVTGTATTATNLADAANITTGTISNDRLPATITKNLTGNVTADTITVGDKFINSSGVGIGTTDTTGRNAGVGTAYGTMLYNVTSGQIEVYGVDGSWYNAATLKKFDATGGTKTNDGTYIRHVFTDPGPSTFVVSPTSPNISGEASILIVGAGGGGGVIGGGGGGGGVITSDAASFSAGVTYNISIGDGGTGGGPNAPGASGGDTTFANPSGPWTLTAKGGGGGGSHAGNFNGSSGQPGGSGGGGSDNSASAPYGTGIQPSQNSGFSAFLISQFGNPGGNGSPAYNSGLPRRGGGGGGAGGAGSPNKPGGDGTPSSILGTEYWWGAGGGAGTYPPGGPGGNGGKGAGGGGFGENGTPGTPGPNGYNPAPSPFPNAGGPAGTNTGGGGGGGEWAGPHNGTRTGGPGIVVIRYPTSV